MRSIGVYRIFLLTGLLAVANFAYPQYGISQSIRLILDSCEHAELRVGTERIYYAEEVKGIYEAMEYQPLWLSHEHCLQLIELVDNAWLDGLLPADYHHGLLVAHAKRPVFNAIEEANNDVLFTDAFLTYAHHLLEGKSNPELLFPEKWECTAEVVDLEGLILTALRNKTFANTLDALRPKTPGYVRLMDELKFMKESNWIPVLTPAGKDLEVGMEDDRIKLIRQRLNVDDTSNSCYDSALYRHVIEFQSHRGLVADGVIGKRTLGSLNESRAAVIGRIKANMERYRWLPHDLPAEYAVVNIPDYSLQLIEGDSIAMSTRVIVGRPDRSTPVFNSVISYLILNPTWTVPPTILKEDVLPAVRHDINYLARHNLRVVNKKGEEIDPSSLPWQKYTYRNFPYELRQDPGTFNSMGQIKFQFPNRYKVFLHDTNARRLFSNAYRALSSGCIRIEQPIEFAARLLRDTKWSADRLSKEILTGKTRTIVLDKHLPISLEYFTMFSDEDGVLQVRDDIYGVDPIVLKSIETPLK